MKKEQLLTKVLSAEQICVLISTKEVKEWLKLGANISYADTRRTVTGGSNDDRSGFMQSALLTPTEIPVYNSDGSFGQAPVKNINWYGNIYNPINLISALNPRYKKYRPVRKCIYEY